MNMRNTAPAHSACKGTVPQSGVLESQGLHSTDYLLTNILGTAIVNSVQFSSVQFSCSVVSDSLRPHESQHTRPPCPSHFPNGASGKELVCQRRRYEMGVQSVDQEDPAEEGKATHSGILAWRITWTEECGGLQTMESQTVRDDWVTNTHTHTHTHTHTGGSSWTRNQTGVSCIAGGFFTGWATREAPPTHTHILNKHIPNCFALWPAGGKLL